MYRTLNDSYIENELGIRYMKTELEEYYANDRKMRKGEVGCFVSHHTIWRKVRKINHTKSRCHRMDYLYSNSCSVFYL